MIPVFDLAVNASVYGSSNSVEMTQTLLNVGQVHGADEIVLGINNDIVSEKVTPRGFCFRNTSVKIKDMARSWKPTKADDAARYRRSRKDNGGALGFCERCSQSECCDRQDQQREWKDHGGFEVCCED